MSSRSVLFLSSNVKKRNSLLLVGALTYRSKTYLLSENVTTKGFSHVVTTINFYMDIPPIIRRPVRCERGWVLVSCIKGGLFSLSS